MSIQSLTHMQAGDLVYLAPELTLVVSAVILSLMDLLMPSKINRNLLGWLAIVALGISAAFVINDFNLMEKLNLAEPKQLLNLSYRVDDFGNLFKLVFLVGTGLTIFMSLGSVKEKDIPHVGEFYYLFLPAVVGAMVMASSGDLITLYVGLELLSITSYILVAMRKQDQLSTEAAYKYVVLGGISSAIILYGMSFLYGMTGSTNFKEINAQLSANYSSFEALIYVAAFLLLAGFGFKIAAAPFHTWTPDVYQGAPTPVTAFLAIISKAAGFAILFRTIYGVFGIRELISTKIYDDIFLGLAVLAAASMIVGNLMALRQTNLKRLLAYSGVANAGYLLIPIASQLMLAHFSNFSEFMYYLIAYLFMNIGVFAVVMIIIRTHGNEDLSSLAGLYYRAPYTAVAMVFLLLSLAGIPVTGGFFGKLFIMLGTIQTQKYWLAATMIITSVISFYYYFRIIRQMFMRSGNVDSGLDSTIPLNITVWLAVVVSLLLGFFPQWILTQIDQIFSLTKDLLFL
ncbi:MAG: NADH-quinone oxidoreductase subunit N [Paenibacillus sp. RIFOXYA1_FULL_44_5]|nr:MAG: NADH-quinone oxidoreductase subunit N [Paenibacillus sp. RIFOXYA1_FULL_44_5]